MWDSAETAVRGAKEAGFAVRRRILARDPQADNKAAKYTQYDFTLMCSKRDNRN